MFKDADRCDQLISALDDGLRTVCTMPDTSRPTPAAAVAEAALTPAERRRSIALMRVNHAGEIAAQALYSGQALTASSEPTRRQLLQAAHEERDHLAWCAQRLAELDGRASLLAPFWYGGSLLIGLVAGAAGDRRSLGFVAETENQVEAHIQDHLRKLPENDRRSRAVLEQMAQDEAHHGTTAKLAGGAEPPAPVRVLMRLGGGFLRRIALRV